jgi:hypothetical protein
MPKPALQRIAAIGVNAALRALIVGVVIDALLHPGAPRYTGKGIGTRGLVVVGASLVVPGLQLVRRRGGYPLWVDNLYLSIFALDMAGNLLDLYDTYYHFDLIPHAHGTGAATVVLAELLPADVLPSIGLAQSAHILLEVQEYYSDVLFDLRNVRGAWDTVTDLLAGVVGSAAYAVVYAMLRRRRHANH